MLVGAHDAVEVESELSEVVVLDRELELGEERERGEGGRDGRVRGRKKGRGEREREERSTRREGGEGGKRYEERGRKEEKRRKDGGKGYTACEFRCKGNSKG